MNYLDEKLMPRKRRGNAIVLTVNPSKFNSAFILNSESKRTYRKSDDREQQSRRQTDGEANAQCRVHQKPLFVHNLAMFRQEPLEFQRSSKRTESSESGSLPIEKTKANMSDIAEIYRFS